MSFGFLGSAAWRPTAASFLVNGTVFGVWATQIPIAKDRLAVSPSTLGLLLLTIGIGALTTMSVGGWLIRRFGSAAVVRWSGAAFCLLLPATALAPTPEALAVVLFLFGAGGGSMDVAMNAHAAQVERRMPVPCMSSFHGMWSLGGLIGSGLGGGLLYVLAPVSQTLVFAGACGGLLWWAQSRYLPHEPPEDPAERESLKPEARVLLIGILMALCFAAEGAVLDWSAIYLREDLLARPELASLGFAAFSGTMALGRFLGDAIRHRLGPIVVLRGSIALAMTGLLLGPLSGSFAPAILGFALTGAGLSNVVPVLIVAASSTRHPNTAVAAAATIGYGGLLAAPPLLGFVADATSLATTFLVVTAMCLLIGLGAQATKPPQPAEA